MKSVLITGGFGFLGSHLIDELIANGADRITVVDNMSSNAVEASTYGGKVVYVLNDLAEYLSHASVSFDEIYHLASIVGPAGVLPHTGQIVKSIVSDAYVVANEALRSGARLAFVSTSEVYGGGNHGYCSEDMELRITPDTSARLEYAVGKLAAETALINLSKSKNLDVVIVRPFNIVGSRQQANGGFVLPRFIDCSLAGKPLTVFGNGQQVRALTHARDVANGLYLAMKKGASGQVYNIGNPANKITMLELAKRVISFVDTESYVKNVDPKTIFGNDYAEANDKYPNANKAKLELGWEPQWDLDNIIKSTLLWTIDIRGGKLVADKGMHDVA